VSSPEPEPLDAEDVAALLAVDKETGQTEFERRRCRHCGGLHERACPRVRRMVFAEGNRLAEVEFWQQGQWDESNIIWPEMLGVIDKPEGGAA
jgi:hypothetical protein